MKEKRFYSPDRDDRARSSDKPQRRPAYGQRPGQGREPQPTGEAAFDQDQGPIERTRAEAPKPPPGVAVVHLRTISFSAFIYNKMVERVEGNPQDGDIVAVADRFGRLFGWGFFHGQAAIALRMLSHLPTPPTDDTLRHRVQKAVTLRRDVLNLDATTDGYRLIHAEGDGLSGLIADRFGQYVVIELFSLAMFRRVHLIEDAIVDAGLNVKDFIVRADKHVMDQEGFALPKVSASKDRQATITENSVQFNVMLSRGHKTGFFYDQRENREALTRFTAGQDVLDVCFYTGGFSCYAGLKGKAASVTAVDLDENALVTARQNAALNGVKVDFHHADAFEFLRKMQHQGRRWPVMICDPSKFVARRDAMEAGLQKYIDLNRLACSVIQPGGLLLTCSCSGLVDQAAFVQCLSKAARFAGREMQILKITGAPADHPIMVDAPEGQYLKAVWARIT